MDKKIWHKHGQHSHDWNKYEDAVDEFIKKKKLRKGDRFHVHHPGRNGPVVYEYLGPNSGGRKDWIRHGRKPRINSDDANSVR